MSTLHTVNKSPFGDGALLSCLRHCRPGDAVLLIEDGIYGALRDTAIAGQVETGLDGVSLFFLSGDARARGVPDDKIMGAASPVGYDGFVDLVAEHDRTQAWL